MAPKKLGKGLESLLSTRHAGEETSSSGGSLWVPVDQLQRNRQQPRKDLERGLEGLANSVRKHGIMQPIVVTRREGGDYEILAGERRWRAAQIAGLKSVPVVVREGVADDAERLELALIENVQREDLNPIERAQACHRLLEEFQLTQEQVAQGLGFNRSTIANLVRLLELPTEIQAGVSRGTISAGHARALLRLSGTPAQAIVYARIEKEGWSVRQTEKSCAQAVKGKLDPTHRPRPRQPPWVSDLQANLARGLGLRSEIQLRRQGGGKVIIHFADLDELDGFARRFELPSETEELLQA